LSIAIVINCTPPPPQNEIKSGFLEKLAAPKKITYLQAGGAVEIAIQGQYYSGSADVQSWGDTLFTIDVFSVFGAPVLNLKYDVTGASVSFQDSSFFIEKSDCMEALPFEWAKLLKIDQFIHLLQSNFEILYTVLNSTPREVEEKRLYKLIWEDSTVSVQQIIHKRSGKNVSLIIKPDKKRESEVRISDFSGTFARKYKFIDDNKNYFSINYEKIKVLNDQ
jgi:hypothetical protein